MTYDDLWKNMLFALDSVVQDFFNLTAYVEANRPMPPDSMVPGAWGTRRNSHSGSSCTGSASVTATACTNPWNWPLSIWNTKNSWRCSEMFWTLIFLLECFTAKSAGVFELRRIAARILSEALLLGNCGHPTDKNVLWCAGKCWTWKLGGFCSTKNIQPCRLWLAWLAVSMFAVVASHLPSNDFAWYRHFSFGRARCFRCFWHSTQFDERLISEAWVLPSPGVQFQSGPGRCGAVVSLMSIVWLKRNRTLDLAHCCPRLKLSQMQIDIDTLGHMHGTSWNLVIPWEAWVLPRRQHLFKEKWLTHRADSWEHKPSSTQMRCWWSRNLWVM